jgi:hypothetical protein
MFHCTILYETDFDFATDMLNGTKKAALPVRDAICAPSPPNPSFEEGLNRLKKDYGLHGNRSIGCGVEWHRPIHLSCEGRHYPASK